MEFEGHELYKIDKNWLFDLTTFIGYHVRLDDTGNVTNYSKAFIASYKDDTKSYSFDKYMDIPTRIMRKAVNIIQNYRKEALLENAN